MKKLAWKENPYQSFTSDLETNLQVMANFDEVKNVHRRGEAIKKLVEAANLFDEIGMEEEAQMLTDLIAVSGEPLSEEVLESLKSKGWDLPEEDGEILEVFESKPEVIELSE